MFKFTPAKSPSSADIPDIITPPSHESTAIDCSFVDGDTPLSGNPAIGLNGSYSEIIDRKPFRRFHSLDIKRSLFSSKRLPEEKADEHAKSPAAKRLREIESSFEDISFKSQVGCENDVKTALNLLATNSDLVADSSRPYAFPTISGKHQDLKSITADTLKDVLSGCYDNKVDKVTVIDCRYPYEYDGGHIKGALNLYTRDAIQDFLNQHCFLAKDQRHILVFHCEFSSERGPRMYRFLRSQDRAINKNNYPKLYFPEVYLLDGGYKAFYYSHKDLCQPQSYTPMLHKDFSADLRRFRAKSKSWTAGEKVKTSSRLTLRF